MYDVTQILALAPHRSRIEFILKRPRSFRHCICTFSAPYIRSLSERPSTAVLKMPRNSRRTSYFTYPSAAEVFSSTYPRPNIPAFSSSAHPPCFSSHQLTLSYRFRNIATTEIIIGSDKASFHVHTNILVAESTYFKAALTSGFEEQDTSRISLSNNKPETVELFVQWCYHQPSRYSVIVEQKILQLSSYTTLPIAA